MWLKSFLMTSFVVFGALTASCSSAKTQAERPADPAPVVEQQATAPADLGATSTGRGL
jgi:hypothetical protein